MAWPNSQERYVDLDVQASKVSATLTDFPLLLTAANLPAEVLDSDDANAPQSDAGDIRFGSAADGGTQYAFEIVDYTPTSGGIGATAEIWVKVPSVSSSVDTTLYMAWKTSGTTSAPAADAANGSEAVWSDYQYVGHMKTDGTDATGNDVSVSTAGTPDDATGKIGGGQRIVTTNSEYYRASAGTFGYPVTLQGWTYSVGSGEDDRSVRAVCLGDASATGQQLNLGANTSGGTSTTDVQRVGSATGHAFGVANSASTWYMLHGVIAASNDCENFTDGVTAGTDTTTVTVTGIDTISILCSADSTPFGDEGTVDEVRVRYSALSASWIAAEYNNQNDPATFVVEGTPAAVAPPAAGNPIAMIL